MDTKNLTIGLLAGAAIGVAIGVLLAPSSGEETRRNIKLGSRRLADSLAGSVKDTYESLNHKFSDGVGEFAKRGEELVGMANEKSKLKI